MKIIFLGTPEFAVPTLEALCENDEHEVLAVFTQPDKPKGRSRKLLPPIIKVVAEKYNLPVFQPENINTEYSHNIIEKYCPDIIVTVAYGQILKKKILEFPNLDALICTHRFFLNIEVLHR